jgi:hypothetical protein
MQTGATVWSIEERRFENGVLNHIRRWNGGETDWGLTFGDLPVIT